MVDFILILQHTTVSAKRKEQAERIRPYWPEPFRLRQDMGEKADGQPMGPSWHGKSVEKSVHLR